MSLIISRGGFLRWGGVSASLAFLTACSSAPSADRSAGDGDSASTHSAGDGDSTSTDSTGHDGAFDEDPSTGDGEDLPDEGGGLGGSGVGGQTSGVDVPAQAPTPPGKQPPQGQLTSGIYDDNLSFDFFKKYHTASLGRIGSGRLPFSWDDHQTAHDRTADAHGARTALDIAIVFDTTGSMGDELDYLKDEFGGITEALSSIYPNAEQRWSLVVYRDQGDEYVTRSQDFTADLQDFQSFLDAQSYGGGGDFPEAPDAGLAQANTLSWSGDDDAAQIIFWVADAPHHEDKAQALAAAISHAQDQNIHIYPVASSGIDDLTEFTMRQSAQLTWGRYLFLTDDSGLGGGHKEPTLPCYYVSTLRDAIVRSVQSEMSGARVQIDDSAVVRFSGRLNVEDNCFYGTGFEATPF
jgi:hypothetical protein